MVVQFQEVFLPALGDESLSWCGVTVTLLAAPWGAWGSQGYLAVQPAPVRGSAGDSGLLSTPDSACLPASGLQRDRDRGPDARLWPGPLWLVPASQGSLPGAACCPGSSKSLFYVIRLDFFFWCFRKDSKPRDTSQFDFKT